MPTRSVARSITGCYSIVHVLFYAKFSDRIYSGISGSMCSTISGVLASLLFIVHIDNGYRVQWYGCDLV